MTEDFTLNKYMKILLRSNFPQFHLLSAESFLKFLEERKIERQIKDLEYYDEIGICKPVLRLHGSLVDNHFKTCISSFRISGIHEYYKNGLIEFPRDDDFKPWNEWKDKNNDNLCMYYHPFQVFGFERITSGLNVRLSPKFCEEITDPTELITRIKKRNREKIEICRKAVKDHWIPRIGFLMLLEESYAIQVRQEYVDSLPPYDSLEKWKEWKFGKFSPQEIMKFTKFTIDEIKELYTLLATQGLWNDPMDHWFVLQHIMKRSRKQKLSGQALLSQDHYEMAEMVSHFIYDMTKERMPDPDEIGNEGWKERIYGSPFDYNSKKTQKAILDMHLFYRPPLIALIYEGETEHEVIKSIFDALYIHDEKSGIIRYNARGVDNIAKNFQGYFDLAKENEIDVFVIVDKDNESIVADHTRNGTIKNGMSLVWERDFEYDNFGIQSVVQAVNELLKSKECKTIEQSKIEEKLKNPNIMLMHAISKEIHEVNGRKLSDLISKPDLAERLMKTRIEEIRKERNSDGWKPKLPIEKKLQEIFRMIPFTL